MLTKKRLFADLLALALFVPKTMSMSNDSNPCDIDQGISGGSFDFASWWARGICIRQINDMNQCRTTLQAILDNVDSLHDMEYSASASLLALLPTLGVMLGSPSVETWLLLKIMPFGGLLALLLSFGSQMIPEGLDKYQDDSTIISDKLRRKSGSVNLKDADHDSNIATRVSERVIRGLKDPEDLGRTQVLFHFGGLFLLFAGSMVSMTLVEYGAVYTNLCTSTWWFHLWYLILTGLSLVDSWASVPFDHYMKIYITDASNYIQVSGQGTSISNTDPKSIRSHLKRLRKTPDMGTTHRTWRWSFRAAKRSKTLIVLISKARHTEPSGYITFRGAVQLFVRLGALTIYVFATSVFAAVGLLALPMAQLALMLVVGPGILARFLTEKLSNQAKQSGSCIHVLADSEEEAGNVLLRLFENQTSEVGLREAAETGTPGNTYIMEIEDSIFVNQALVLKRSPWPRRLLGLLAAPAVVNPSSEDHILSTAK